MKRQSSHFKKEKSITFNLSNNNISEISLNSPEDGSSFALSHFHGNEETRTDENFNEMKRNIEIDDNLQESKLR